MSRGRAAAAAALALAACFVVAERVSIPFADNWGHAEVECGEQLLHGRAQPRYRVSYSMPLTSVSSAWLFGHLGLEGGRLAWAALLAVIHVLAAALALAAGGWSAAAAAAGLIATLAWAWTIYPMNALYAAGFLLAAGLLARREREPSVSNGLLLGLGVGVTVLQRSPLVFFPFLLLARDVLRPRTSRPSAAAALAPLAAPALLLLPWIWMNWRLWGRFVPLEEGRIEGLLAVSIAGVEKTVSAGAAGFESGLLPGLQAWLRAAAASPWAYAASCAGRARWMLEGQPVLFAAAAAGAWLGRARPEIRGLALLAAYYAGIHCLIAISEAYVVPLWPLLAVLGGVAACELLRRLDPKVSSPRPEALAAVLPAALALATAAAGWSLFLVARYPARVAAAEAAAAPEEAWPLMDEARRLLARGDARAAGALYRRALALRPAERRLYVGLAWCLALEGHPSPLLLLKPEYPYDGFVAPEALSLLKASEHLERGRRERARAEIREALSRGGGRPALDPIAEYLPSMPPARRRRLVAAIDAEAAASGRAQDAALAAAREALGRGDRAAARAAARRLEDRPLSVALAKELADLLAELGEKERALRVLTASARRDPGEARPWLHAAELAHSLGRGEEARASLAAAARAARGEEELMLLAFARGRLGDPAGALALLDSLSRRPDARGLVERAAFEAEAGRPEDALRTLAAARPFGGAAHAERAAWLYARLGRFEEASSALDTAGAPPAVRASLAGLLLERAEAAAGAGRPDEARRLLASLVAARSGDARRIEVLRARLEGKAPAPAPVRAAVAPKPPVRDERFLRRLEAARLAREGRVEEAAAALETQLRAAPGDVEVRVDLSELRRRQGRAEEALSVLGPREKASSRMLAARAAALLALGRRGEAAADLAGAESGGDAEALAAAAHGWQELKEYARAEAALTRLAALRPKAAAPLSDRGLVRHLAGRAEEAVADLERAIALEPDFLPAYLTLGSLRSAQGRRAEAARLYGAALARPSAAREPALKSLLETALREAR